MYRDFEDILRKLSPTLRRITHKLNGHFSFFDEDDLFQEALEHLWVTYEQGKLNDKTDSYVLQGCYFHLKNYLRKTLDKMRLTSLNAVLDENDSALQDFLVYDGAEVSDAMDTACLLEAAKANRLTEREVKVLSLCLDGLTVREVGLKLGVSHVMIIKLRNRIKSKCRNLKNKLQDGYHN